MKYNTSQLWKKGNTTEERAQVLERGRKAANEEFKKHIQYLEILAKQLDIPMPDYAKVSGAFLLSIMHGYGVEILSSLSWAVLRGCFSFV